MIAEKNSIIIVGMSDGHGAEVRGTPEKVTPEQMQRLGTLGRGMLQEAAQRPGAKDSSPALKMVDALRTGIDPRTGEPLEDAGLTGGHLLMTPKEFKVDVDGTLTTDRLCVAGIVKKNPNGTYECTFAPVGPDGTVGEVLSVKGNISPEDLIDMQAAAEASALSGLFTGDAKEAFDTYTTSRHEGSEFMPSSKTDTLVGKVAADFGIPIDQNPQTERENYTPEQQRVADEIRRLEGKTGELSSEEQKLLGILKLSQVLQAGETGNLATYSGLKAIQDALATKLGRKGKTFGRVLRPEEQNEWDRLQEMMDDLQENAEIERDALFDKIKEGGVEDKQLKEWQDKVDQKPGGLLELFEDSKFLSFLPEAKGSEACKMLFGKDLTEKELQGLLGSPELKKAIESGDTTSIWMIILKWAGIVAAAAVAAPVVGAVGAGFAVTSGFGRQG